jgi:hypothetical protein
MGMSVDVDIKSWGLIIWACGMSWCNFFFFAFFRSDTRVNYRLFANFD